MIHELLSENQGILEVEIENRTAESVIADLLTKAQVKGKMPTVARSLVGASLTLRLGHDIPFCLTNSPNGKHDTPPGSTVGDFEINDVIFEIAIDYPSEDHLDSISAGLDLRDSEFWLLTCADRAATWKNELEKYLQFDIRCVVITSIEAFVGQNVTELGEFSAKDKIAQLRALFDIYNNRWVSEVGTPGIRIVAK